MAHFLDKKSKSRISDADYSILSTGKKVTLGGENNTFGKSSRDYIEMNIYTTTGTFLDSIRLNEPNQYVNADNEFEINPGVILRRNGYFSGDYEIEFNFFREIAGSNQTVLVDEQKKIYNGDFNVLIDGSIVKDDGSNETLEEIDYKYFVHQISNDKQEVRLATLPINNLNYKKEFESLGDGKSVIYPANVGNDNLQFDNPSIKNSSDFKISDNSNIQIDDRLIGGKLVINDAYEIMDLSSLGINNDGFAITRGKTRVGGANINIGDQQTDETILFRETFNDVGNDSKGGAEQDMLKTAREAKEGNGGLRLFDGAFIMGYKTARKGGFPFKLETTITELQKIKKLDPKLEIKLTAKDLISNQIVESISKQNKTGKGNALMQGTIPLPDIGNRDTGFLYDAEFKLTFNKGSDESDGRNTITISKPNLFAVLPDYKRGKDTFPANRFIEQGFNF